MVKYALLGIDGTKGAPDREVGLVYSVEPGYTGSVADH